jgi:hypothetical protein
VENCQSIIFLNFPFSSLSLIMSIITILSVYQENMGHIALSDRNLGRGRDREWGWGLEPGHVFTFFFPSVP